MPAIQPSRKRRSFIRPTIRFSGDKDRNINVDQDEVNGMKDEDMTNEEPLEIDEYTVNNFYRRCQCHCRLCRTSHARHFYNRLAGKNISDPNVGNQVPNVANNQIQNRTQNDGRALISTSLAVSKFANKVNANTMAQQEIFDDEFVIILLGLFLLIAVGVWQDFFHVFYIQAFPGQESNVILRFIFALTITIIMALIIFVVIKWLNARLLD